MLTETYCCYHIVFLYTHFPSVMVSCLFFLEETCTDHLLKVTEVPRCIPMQALHEGVENLGHWKIYAEVTESGCKDLCLHLHDHACTILIYFPNKRDCLMIPRIAVDMNFQEQDCETALIFERKRCTGGLLFVS